MNTHPKVLIVDDSQTNLALLEHMLDKVGCEVVLSQSGKKAVDLVRDTDFALVLLDIQMPDMNGYEVATQIKAFDHGKHIPIIFITAIFQDEEHIKQGYETGAVDYLFRPMDMGTLRQKVEVFLEMNRQKLLLEEEIERRKHSEDSLRQGQDKYRSIFERAVEGIFQSTMEGELRVINAAMVELFGYDSAEELMGKPGMRREVMIDPSERHRYFEILLRDGYITNFEFRAKRKDGEFIWCSESSRLVTVDGEQLIEGVLEDVTNRKQEEIELKHLATVDSLTGLYNRHLFFDRLEHALACAKRYNRSAAVLFVDLDEFKQVNDTYGHQTGDELLQKVARRLEGRIRESDTLARLGGDEFGVLLYHVEGKPGAVVVAENLIDVLEKPFEICGKQIQIGATIGISFYPDDAKDAVSLISRADAAMYEAKRYDAGRIATYQESRDFK